MLINTKLTRFFVLTSFILSFLLTGPKLWAQDEKVLKNPELIERYHPTNKHDFETGEHAFINMFVGAFTGGVFGGAAGLSMYKEDDNTNNENNLIKFAAIGGAAGLIGGGIITFFEFRKNLQFTMGKDVLDHTWYGGLGGAMLGALIGLIPYSSSKKTEDILTFTGYGSAAGVAIGLGIYAFYSLPRANYTAEMKFNTWFDPQVGSVNFSLQRRF